MDVINDFDITQDVLYLQGASFNEPLSITEITEDQVTSTLIDLGGLDLGTDIPTGNGVMLLGVSVADFSNAFVIVEPF